MADLSLVSEQTFFHAINSTSKAIIISRKTIPVIL